MMKLTKRSFFHLARFLFASECIMKAALIIEANKRLIDILMAMEMVTATLNVML